MDDLERKAELLELLFQATNDGVVDWDLLTNKTQYNDRWRFLLGWDEGDLVLTPNTWRESIHEDERAEVEKALSDHLETCWPFVLVTRMRHRTLGWRWILIRGKARHNAEGAPVRMVILFADIDQRVRVEAHARALTEAIPDVILSVRSDGSILAAKEENCAEGSAPPATTAHALWEAILASAVGPRVMECLRTVGQRAQVTQIPCRLRQAAGESVDYDLRIVRSGGDQAVCIIRDVTREKSVEEHLARGRQLEAIGQLASGLAHEINTPLQFVGDNLVFAKEAIPPLLSLIDDLHARLSQQGPDTAAAIVRREEEADLPFARGALVPSLTHALEGLASIARIVQAMKTFENVRRQEHVRVELNPIVENATKVATCTWGPFVDVAISLDDKLPLVPCIPGEIAQAIMNLVINAAQAVADKVGSSGTRGTISVETLARPDEGMVEIRVRDSGGGIPEAIRTKVFDPFFTTRPPGQGTGQGLAQVQAAVVRLHGGSVDFDSVEGEGTTFIVRLPLRRPAASVP